MASKAIISGKNELVKLDVMQWGKNLRKFIAPLGVIYVTSVIGIVSQEAHNISIQDLIPSTFVMGAMSLYILNSLLDLFNKWSQEIRYTNGDRTLKS